MGLYTRYKCRDCRFEAELGGPEEFYIDAEGKRQFYGHPVPVSEEAVERGIAGFWLRLWCDECRREREVVIAEFDTPRQRPSEAWGDLQIDQAAGVEPKCPKCGSKQLREVLDDDTCPRCAKGRLQAQRMRT